MCYGCYEEYGKPTIANDRVIAAADLIKTVYDFCSVGGNLHIVVDDWNIEDDNLSSCSRWIDEGGFPDKDRPDQLAAERTCCDALMALSVDERASALAIHDGFFEPPRP